MNACRSHMRDAYAGRTCETEMHGRTDGRTDAEVGHLVENSSPFVTRAKKAEISSSAKYAMNGTAS